MTDTATPAKPPLSDPMAEALAEDAAAATARAAEKPAEAPEPLAEPEPQPEPAAASGEPAEGTETPAAAEPEPKPEKSPVKVMQGRIGHLTKQLHEREANAAELTKQNEAMRQLLAAQGKTPDGTETPPAAANGARTYTQAEFQAAAAEAARATEFNRRADDVFQAGAEKFGDWKESIESLNSMGLMSPAFAEAAMESGAPTDVLHHLGSDLDEAVRIATLPPVKMAIEIAKLATKLTAPKHTPISKAPAPITPIGGSVAPVVDFSKLADGNDMNAYVAARAKAGDPWATGRRRS